MHNMNVRSSLDVLGDNLFIIIVMTLIQVNANFEILADNQTKILSVATKNFVAKKYYME